MHTLQSKGVEFGARDPLRGAQRPFAQKMLDGPVQRDAAAPQPEE